MQPVLFILAAVGVSAVLWRLARALLRLAERSGRLWLLRGAASSRERSGDLTGLGEASALERRARSEARAAGLLAAFWFALLVVPAFTPWTLAIYATCSLLWLASGRIRSRAIVRRDGTEIR